METAQQINYEKPSKVWLLTEGGRALIDWGLSWVSQPIWDDLPNGNGEPVLLLPGFMASDSSMSSLRKFLKTKNYAPYRWELGTNVGNFSHCSPLLLDRIKLLSDQHGKKVTLIGWSLGGVFARELAKELPESVKSVITLGSPFGNIHRPNNASWLFQLMLKFKRADTKYDKIDSVPLPPPVPCTAIYSKSDGIVSWQDCLEKPSRQTENVQVSASHIGIGVHPSSFICIADRLAQPEGQWKPFRPDERTASFFPSFLD